MSEFRPLTVSRDKLARALGNQPEVIRAVEQLIQRVGQDMPTESAALQALVTHLEIATGRAASVAEVALQQSLRRARAGDGLIGSADGAGDVLRLDHGAARAFAAHHAVVPDVRGSGGISVARDAQGYVVSASAGDAQSILAAQIFGKH